MYNYQLDFEKTIKVLPIIITTILAIKAIIEYKKTQKWKKNEFLAKEIKDFFENKDVKRALLILDWNKIDLPLYENEIPENKERSIFFEDYIHLRHSLSTDINAEFTDEETIVRKSIDEFLVKLSMFQNYIDNKLITTNDLNPYLKYWMKMIGDKEKSRRDSTYTENLWNFIEHFEYDQIVKLLEKFNYNIKNKK